MLCHPFTVGITCATAHSAVQNSMLWKGYAPVYLWFDPSPHCEYTSPRRIRNIAFFFFVTLITLIPGKAEKRRKVEKVSNF